MGSITHAKVSAITDDSAAVAAGQVVPSDWNDDHVIDLTTADLPDSSDKRYVTDAQKTVIGNTSGRNTGDQTGVSGNAGTATALQNARTIDGQSFNGTGNITVIAPGTHAATTKATPVDNDEIPLVDSAASNVLKKLTWANLKATLKTYLDTLYIALSGDLGTPSGGDLSNCTGTAAGLSVGNADAATSADTVTTNANLTGDVTSSGNATSLTITSGTWTPVDSSGASLTLTSVSGTYMKIGKMVFITGEFVYPTTADTNTAEIGGLPYTSTATKFGLATNKTVSGSTFPASPYVVASGTSIKFAQGGAKDTNDTNAIVSGNSFRISGFYLTT